MSGIMNREKEQHSQILSDLVVHDTHASYNTYIYFSI